MSQARRLAATAALPSSARFRARLTALLPRIRRLALLAPFIAGVALIVGGIALVYPPAGLVAAGLATLALMFFDPDHASRLTWPR